MLIPEVTLYKFIKSCLQLMRADFQANSGDDTKTIIYALFNKDDNDDVLLMESYNYFTQAKSIFTRNNDKQNHLDVNIGYNMQRANLPTMHIILPSEGKGRYDSVGKQSIIDNTYSVTNQTMTMTKETSYSPSYSILISSLNSSEVLLVYYWLRAMFVMFSEHLELKGLQNLHDTGADIVFQQDLLPNVFHRNITLEFDYVSQYKVTVPTQLSNQMNLLLCGNLSGEYHNYINNNI